MGDSTELFRRQALQAQTKNLIGEVVLYRPLSFTWLTLVSLVFATAIIAFLALASYTRKEVATGYLTPNKGNVRILTPLIGKITERRTAEGAQVRAGDVLFVVSAERESLDGVATAILAEVGQPTSKVAAFKTCWISQASVKHPSSCKPRPTCRKNTTFGSIMASVAKQSG
ncbi:MAG: hypothetical protein ING51_04005 [Rhodocyclaceae bacterium]|nr:hypothetical protein [Rhodocyclaceae bacterium]